MIVGNIQIFCPPMLCWNTGLLITSPRRAVELPCKWTAVVKDVGATKMYTGMVTFASCLIRFQSPGRWLVNPVLAERPGISLSYPAEPVVRQGSLMLAKAVDNIVPQSWIELAGKRYWVYAPLKDTLADPGILWGMFSFTVRATRIDGTLLDSLGV